MGQAGNSSLGGLGQGVRMRADKNFIEEIRNADEEEKIKLTQKEEEFLESIEGRLDLGKELTVAQREWLDRIHDRIDPW